MNSGIIYIKNANELELAKCKILSKSLIEYTATALKKLDLDKIFLVGGQDETVDGLIKRYDIRDAIKDVGTDQGKCIVVSPLYPSISTKDYLKLFNCKDEGSVLLDDNKACVAFLVSNVRLQNYSSIDIKKLTAFKTDSERIIDFKDIPDITEDMKLRINISLIDKGVNIMDPSSTYISPDATIDKNTIIYPNVFIEGKCTIGKDNIITSGTNIKNVTIGDNNNIKSSYISDAKIGSGTLIGPYAQIRNDCVIGNEVRIGNYVEIKTSTIGNLTRIAHLAYVGDATVGEDVNIGCGAITINYDGSRKHPTIIKDHAFIGSNANLIAPITIGEYGMVAAGTTADKDVKDGDMAISRLYQTNKKGYGYRYINKEN